MKKQLFLICLCFFSFSLFAQLEFSGEVTAEGYYSTGDKLPFWMYHNKRGRISENTNVAGWITGKAVYSFGAASSLEVGAGVLYQDGIGNNIFLDEAYIQYKNDWLQIIGGRKQKEELYNGLSATNENILWSLNARPLPGIQFRTNRPVMVFPEAGIGFEASLEEYVMEKNRHVSHARVHHKRFHLVYQPDEEWRIRAGIQHFAQWGGVSQTTGQQPVGFTDYLKVFTGIAGGENAVDGDQVNVLGNHLGSYELYIKKSFPDWSLEFIYNHIFEDGSGGRYANFPDGRYGLFFDFENEKSLVNSFIYEIYYTKNQSVYSPQKNDAYFNNYLTYRSGWTYHQRVLGAPFFKYDPVENRIENNSFLAHHIGISGSFGNFFTRYPYKLLVSYARNDGTIEKIYYPAQDVVYWSFELQLLQNFVDLSLQLSGNYDSYMSPVYGAGVSLKKKF